MGSTERVKFGGDPDNVTLFGISGGGAAIQALVSPKAPKIWFIKSSLKVADIQHKEGVGWSDF